MSALAGMTLPPAVVIFAFAVAPSGVLALSAPAKQTGGRKEPAQSSSYRQQPPERRADERVHPGQRSRNGVSYTGERYFHTVFTGGCRDERLLRLDAWLIV